MKVQLELKNRTKKVIFLKEVLNNYEVKKILFRKMSNLLDYEVITVDIDNLEYEELLKFKNFLKIKVLSK